MAIHTEALELLANKVPASTAAGTLIRQERLALSKSGEERETAPDTWAEFIFWGRRHPHFVVKKHRAMAALEVKSRETIFHELPSPYAGADMGLVVADNAPLRLILIAVTKPSRSAPPIEIWQRTRAQVIRKLARQVFIQHRRAEGHQQQRLDPVDAHAEKGREENRRDAGKFVPSDKLAIYVARGMAKLRTQVAMHAAALPSASRRQGLGLTPESEPAPQALDSAQQLAEAKKNISWNVPLALSAIGAASQRKLTTEKLFPIADGSRFTDEVSAALLEAIPVGIYDVKDFLYQLYEELVPVAEAERVAGDWGKLVFSEGTLALKIKPRSQSKQTSWVKAKVVKSPS